jgi:hypothetical protein
VELRDLETFGEPGAMVYLADRVDLMKIIPPGSVDVVFADPPYRLSNGGVTAKNGRRAPVDKGAWDRSTGFAGDHRFNVGWLPGARRILKSEGTIWVTGTHHIIFSLPRFLRDLFPFSTQGHRSGRFRARVLDGRRRPAPGRPFGVLELPEVRRQGHRRAAGR